MDEKPRIEFEDFLKLMALSFPFLLGLYLVKKVLPLSEVTAILTILFSVYSIWIFHILMNSKGTGLGKFFRMKTFGEDLLWSIIIFPFVFGVYLLMVFLTSRIWKTNLLSASFSLNTNAFLMVLALGLFIPVAEEVLFRGMLYNYMCEEYSAEFSMVTVSLAFAIIHPYQEWMKMFVLGMLLNLLYYKRKTLTVPATIHVMINLLYLSITYLYASKV